MFGRKLVKRCPRGHEMELEWRRCPRCTGRAAVTVAARDIVDQTVVALPPSESADHTRVVQPAAEPADNPVAILARLAATAGPLAGQELRVLAGRTKLGKAPREEPDAALHVVPDGYMSKDHAAIMAGPGGVVLVDLGSTNGTFVNGQRTERAVLKDGDEIRLGGSTFRVSLGGKGR